MSRVTIDELQNNLNYYLELSSKEDIYVIDNSEVISVLTSPEKYRMLLIDEISGSFGKIDENTDYNDILENALTEKLQIATFDK